MNKYFEDITRHLKQNQSPRKLLNIYDTFKNQECAED